jgi:hypothetical protein
VAGCGTQGRHVISQPGRPLKLRAARWAGLAVRVLRALFAPAAVAAVSVGIGELAGHVFGRGLAPWVALTIGGGFGLLLASELNRAPRPAPRRDDGE